MAKHRELRGVRLGGQPRGAEKSCSGSVYADPDGRGIRGQGSHDRRDGRAHRRGLPLGRPSSGRVFPWQGVRSMAQPYTPRIRKALPRRQGQQGQVPGGPGAVPLRRDVLPSDLAFKLGIHPDDGAFHLHANDGGQLEQYAKELCAEVG